MARRSKMLLTNMQPSENAIHLTIAQFLHLIELSSQIMFWHTPNGELRNLSVAALLKRMGVKRGVYDFIVWTRQGLLFAEVKSSEGRLSAEQVHFKDKVTPFLKALGIPHEFLIWRGLDGVRADLKRFGVAVPEVI